MKTRQLSSAMISLILCLAGADMPVNQSPTTSDSVGSAKINQSGQQSVNVHRFKEIRRWTFSLVGDTMDYDFTIGMPGIALHGDELLFANPTNVRVNSLNVRTGALILGSTRFTRRNSSWEDIDKVIRFGAHVFAIGHGNVLVFDTLLHNYRLDEHQAVGAGPLTIHSVSEDSLKLHGYKHVRSDSSNARTDLSRSVYITYDKNLNFAIETGEPKPRFEGSYLVQRSNQTTKINGKPFQRYVRDSVEWLDCGDYRLEIPKHLSTEIEPHNTDFSSRWLVFYSQDNDSLLYYLTAISY